MNDKLETMWKIYDTINALIKFSDAKATAILALNGVMLTFIFSLFNKYNLMLNNKLLFSFLLIGLLLGIISTLFCIKCINPILDFSGPKSLIFFGDISKNFKYHHEYARTVRNEYDEFLQLTQIADQVWIISGIACKKYKSMRIAIYFFAGMFILIGLTLIIIIIFIKL